MNWLPAFGISYHMGVDGISVALGADGGFGGLQRRDGFMEG